MYIEIIHTVYLKVQLYISDKSADQAKKGCKLFPIFSQRYNLRSNFHVGKYFPVASYSVSIII